jgi:membrane fusion protein (multidrug efflux system)
VGAAWLCGSCQPSAPQADGAGAADAPGLPVVAIDARRQPVVESVSLVGTLAANEAVEVQAETDGIVREILFQEGQPVQRGDLLLQLDDTKLTADLAEATAKLKLYEADFARARHLLEDRLISQQEYDQAASAFEAGQATVELRKRQLHDARVTAPFAGTTGARRISPGQYITRNTVVTWLVDLDPVKVEMNIPERFLSKTQVGQVVEFEVTAYPEQNFEGELYFIDSRLDLATRTALVKTQVPNPDGQLKAGMVANLELNLVLREDAVVIPEAAIMNDGDTTFVYLVNEEQQVVLRPLVIGQRLPRWVEVIEGLTGGETVIVEGHQKIGPSMKVTVMPPEQATVYDSDLGPGK